MPSFNVAPISRYRHEASCLQVMGHYTWEDGREEKAGAGRVNSQWSQLVYGHFVHMSVSLSVEFTHTQELVVPD